MTRKLIRKIEEMTNLSYCDRDCPCGDNNQLLWQNSGGKYPAWLPDWCNGATTDEVYDWLLEQSCINGEIRAAMISAHMRVGRTGAP